MRELCSGRIPQNAIFSRARVDPVAVLGTPDHADQFYACPPNVPLLIFVGISYNGGSRSRPVVSVATGGQMPIPHEEPGEGAHILIGAQCWWQRSAAQYGSTTNFYIAVPKVGVGDPGTFMAAGTRALCGISVQQATGMDCAVLLGVPPF